MTRQPELLCFYRAISEIEDLDPDAYMENAIRAFPDLFFVPGLSSQIPRFHTPYGEIRPRLTKHLAVLNDHLTLRVARAPIHHRQRACSSVNNHRHQLRRRRAVPGRRDRMTQLRKAG